MFNESLNNSLLELEESLSKINSARNQVNTVAESSAELIATFKEVMQQLKAIDSILHVDKGKFREKLDDSFNSLNIGLNKVTNDASSKSKELSNELDNIAISLSGKLTSLNIDIAKFREELQETENRISKLDLKKDFIEEFIKYHSESNSLFEHKITQLETKINSKLVRGLVIMIVGFILLGIVMIFK